MNENSVRRCPKCGQTLRFPENVGGMLMACPNCGYRFISTFKLADASHPAQTTRPPAASRTPSASEDAETRAASPLSTSTTTLAARVAALYASNL